MAYDEARGQLVSFGGLWNSPAGTYLDDTWVGSGANWNLKLPVSRPPRRVGHAMAYDAARRQVVLFGGNDASTTLSDTWVWDGSNWSQKQPLTSPPAKFLPLMAYDATRQQVVMYSGSGQDDTWIWDGTNWTNKLPAHSPAQNVGAAMASDPAHGLVVLFGGNGVPGETWVWDGSDWTLKSTVNAPPSRVFHQMATDGLRGQVVLFGGRSPLNSELTYSDTWTWDGTNWTDKSATGGPPSQESQPMAYDGGVGKVMMLGNSSWQFETWHWDGTAWTTQKRPPPRHLHSLTYDAAHAQVVVFGGGTAGSNNQYLNDTWVRNGVNWTEKTPANSPSARMSHAAAYDAERKQVVLFGGVDGSYLADTWVWDGVNWTQKTPANSPSFRRSHAMVYDPVRHQVVLFGGEAGGFLNDTWVWDGTNWTLKIPAHSPPARHRHAMAYDKVRGQLVLYGGYDYEMADFRNDTWVWDGTDWTEKHPNNIPSPSYSHAMVAEEIRGRIVLFGGMTNNWKHQGYSGETWVWDGTDWTAQQTAAGSPRERMAHAMAWDTGRGAVVLFGGSMFNAYDDTWQSTGGGTACTYAISATSIRIPPAAFTGSLTVTRSSLDCPWNPIATGTRALAITSDDSATTTGHINYRVEANTLNSVRTGTIVVGGKVFTVTQDDVLGCGFDLSPTEVAIPSGATNGSFTVTTSGQNCPWYAAANSQGYWLYVVSTASSGTATGQVGFNAMANPTTAERTGEIWVAGRAFIVRQAGFRPVTLSVDRKALTFGTTRDASVKTPPQDVLLTMTGGSNNWTAVSSSAWLGVAPASGSGSGKFSVSVVPGAVPAVGTYTGTITVNAIGATNGPLVVNYTLTVKSTTAVPFGAFDTPTNNATGIAGNIAVTGWALDDIGVKTVTLWRDPVGPEPTHANGYVYIADALFVPGARPDVETAYPGSPQANRAGWGYLMLTNGLPGGSGPKGNGVFKLHAIATDEEGNQVNLGMKTITVDNLNSLKPFGTLDTPAPGATVSGTYLNWGWAMTPQPGLIAVDGLQVWVSVDGVSFAHPVYGIKRADIAASFPGYANSDTGVGYYQLDTTRFSNGLHNLGWLVYDNLNRGDGIGSRFIQIQNAAAAGGDPEPAVQAERTFQLRTARLRRPAEPVAGYPAYRHGYDLDAALTPIRQAGEGLLEAIEVKELDRLEIHLPGGAEWTAALRVGEELRALPAGSTLDAEGGIFYWQLGPVFLGEYMLEFHAGDGRFLVAPVRVR